MRSKDPTMRATLYTLRGHEGQYHSSEIVAAIPEIIHWMHDTSTGREVASEPEGLSFFHSADNIFIQLSMFPRSTLKELRHVIKGAFILRVMDYLALW
jgi:hypothetical protein